jgi:hypothetical protein
MKRRLVSPDHGVNTPEKVGFWLGELARPEFRAFFRISRQLLA